MKKIHLNKILYPTDFSDFSYYAANYAVAMAEQYDNSELHIVHVTRLGSVINSLADLYYIEHSDGDLEETAIKAAEERLQAFVDNKIPKHINSKLKVLHGGRSHEAISKYGIENKISVIVIATHGHSGIKHTVFGSTTERLIRIASCPVLSINPFMEKKK